MFFEGIQKQSNAETFKKLAYCQATILLWCYWNELKYTILPPSHWRKTLKDKYGLGFGNNRAQQKKTAQALVQEIFELNVSEDTADAICIGLAGILEKESKKSAF